MKWILLAILAGVGVGLVGANAAHAQSEGPRPTRAAVMQTACAAVDAAACGAKAETAVARGESFQLVILQGCLVEFSQSAFQGPEEVDAAKERANRCLESAVRQAPHLEAAAIASGQQKLRTSAHLAALNDGQFVSAFRQAMTAADQECSRVRHLYTRYNCYTRRLHNLLTQP